MINAEKIRKKDAPSPPAGGISSTELRSAFSLGGILSLRMLGLAMILPVFSLYAVHLRGNTPFLTGLAIGAYGLSQALLQIPFGILSDRIGRKTIIVLGLLIFAAGSVVAALSGSIYGVIAGRAMQGGGAIAAAVMALLADLTRVNHRIKAMAILGICIGTSFTLALLLGPVFNSWIGVPGIFWLTACLALVGILITCFIVPRPEVSSFHNDAEPVPAMLGAVLRNRQLLRLDVGILSLHIFITASFVALPLALRDAAGLDASHHWQLYLPVLLLSVVAMIPFIILSEKYHRIKEVFLGSVALISLSELGLAISHDHLIVIAGLLFLFFTAFNILEASLASLVSRMTSPESKGTAMGVYSSFQFFGAFLGGGTGGWLLGVFGSGGVFAFCAAVAVVWLFIAAGMERP